MISYHTQKGQKGDPGVTQFGWKTATELHRGVDVLATVLENEQHHGDALAIHEP
jgi:hypothetical protein